MAEPCEPCLGGGGRAGTRTPDRGRVQTRTWSYPSRPSPRSSPMIAASRRLDEFHTREGPSPSCPCRAGARASSGSRSPPPPPSLPDLTMRLSARDRAPSAVPPGHDARRRARGVRPAQRFSSIPALRAAPCPRRRGRSRLSADRRPGPQSRPAGRRGPARCRGGCRRRLGADTAPAEALPARTRSRRPAAVRRPSTVSTRPLTGFIRPISARRGPARTCEQSVLCAVP